MRTLVRTLLASLLTATTACSPADPPASADNRTPEQSSRAATADPGRREADAPKIVILGDSLTAGLGLDRRESFPSLLQERLDREGHNYEVVNAVVSGDTSAGGLRRLDWALEGTACAGCPCRR
jgi:hypothetical protein